MKKQNIQDWKNSLSDIYNLKDDHAKGRTISLGSSLMTSFYNVFITGIFYTGFLSMYGISITGVGIITFIPFISSMFSVFSSKILGKIQRRKPVLLASKIYFYAMYIVATTLMPQFVTDPDGRLKWFVVIQFLAHAVYALFSPGITTWFYAFYPEDNERRTRYIMLNQIFSSCMSSAVLLLSGVLTDAVADSSHQQTLILGLRYFAFLLVLVDVGMQACAKEYPYPESPQTRLAQVFTLPLRYRKFLLCMLMMFFWNLISNFNNGLWNYHLLNHMHFSYTLINTMSMAYTIILMLSASFWRRVLRRYSWIKTFGLTNLIWVPTEIAFFFMTPERTFMYVPLVMIQNFLSAGFNLSYANVLYMNLPEEDSTTCIAFQTIGCNLFAFLGLMIGTFVSSITGDSTIQMLGMPVYSVQFTVLMRAVAMSALGWVLTVKWRSFTRDQDIQEVEDQDACRAAMRARRRSKMRSTSAR